MIENEVQVESRYYVLRADGTVSDPFRNERAALQDWYQDYCEGLGQGRVVGGPLHDLPPVAIYGAGDPRDRDAEYQYHERMMATHTAAVLRLRPGVEPRDIVDAPLVVVVARLRALRGFLESSMPATSRELFRALNALDGVTGCARCAFPPGRHATYCGDPTGCRCGKSFRTGEDYRDHLPCEGP